VKIKPTRHFQKNNLDQRETKRYQCLYCEHIITLKKQINVASTLTCPRCGRQGLISIKPYDHKKTKYTKKAPSKKNTLTPLEKKIQPTQIKQYISQNIIEIILITIGIIYLTQPTINNIKISFTFILIATFLLFLMTGETQPTNKPFKTPPTTQPYHKQRIHTSKFLKSFASQTQKVGNIPLSNRISIILIIWTLIIYIITTDLEIYLILIFIGILITRELTDIYTSNMYKKRLDAYIIIFLFTYTILISQKIIEILSA
jgi:DNA-directed RNA polymerase subunit RPC12/RpoP